VTKPLTEQLTKVGEAENRGGGTRIGLETTFTINRSDFGMDQMIGPVGDEVTLIISFEATSK
jgi:polyisoprenoid-binding protein YceI